MNKNSSVLLVGNDPLTFLLSEKITKFAPSRFPVLITGESGSGKEVAARLIHLRSLRREGPWVALNCAALPETLIESELFGHERGAFSGATSGRMGVFEQAHGGTLFLDELGELPLSMQSKLLRVLELGCFRRVGGNRDVHVDVRVVAATNRDLQKESIEGRFRQDLYFRLAVCLLHLHPLRERVLDIVPLANFFLKGIEGSFSLSEDACELLLRYNWPGNVRELRNLMYRATLLGEGSLLRADILGLALPEIRAKNVDTSTNVCVVNQETTTEPKRMPEQIPRVDMPKADITKTEHRRVQEQDQLNTALFILEKMLPFVESMQHKEFRRPERGILAEVSQKSLYAQKHTSKSYVCEDTPEYGARELSSPEHMREFLEKKQLYGGSLRISERTLLLHALESSRWNRRKASEILGIARSTLRMKMRKHGLCEEEEPCGAALGRPTRLDG